MAKLTRHQRRARSAKARAEWLERRRKGVVQEPPPPLHGPVMLAGLQAGYTRREIRLAEQQALRTLGQARTLKRALAR